MAVQAPTPKTKPEIPRLAYGAREFAEAFGVTERTVRQMYADGEIQTIRIRGRVLIPASEVYRLLTPVPQKEGGRHDD